MVLSPSINASECIVQCGTDCITLLCILSCLCYVYAQYKYTVMQLSTYVWSTPIYTYIHVAKWGESYMHKNSIFISHD